MDGERFSRATFDQLGPLAARAHPGLAGELALAASQLAPCLGAPLDPRAFAARLGPLLAAGRAPVQLHAGDLLLAWAAGQRLPGALQELERRHLAAMVAALRQVDPSPTFVDELLQQLRERLFVGRYGRGPALHGYSGAGALGGFLRIAARRAALTDRSRSPAPADAEGDLALLDLRDPHDDPELRHLKARFRPQFEAALRAALAALTVRERTLLRLRYHEGVQGQRLASMYGVDPSNISRALSNARARLRQDTRQRLVGELGLSASQVEQLFGLLLSRLDLSLRGALASAGGDAG